jgi:predicted rRNA methylase YqxC with S4 and FtsJ domains
MTQAVIDYLPGYMFNGRSLVSTGVALPPTQHINKETGQLVYYVRPLFEHGANVGMFVKHQGIVDSLTKTKNEEQ